MHTTKEKMTTTKQKVSYCLGLQCGADIVNQFKDLEKTMLIKGFLDAINDIEPELSHEEISATLSNLRQQIDMQRKQYIAQIAEQNKKDGEAFLQENQKKEDVITLSTGLQYKILKKGEGLKHPTLFDTVSVHYKGNTIDGRVFDSSFERGEPVSFPLNGVIPGWSEVLQLMHVGDCFQAFIPHYLAYGEHGFGREIAPNSTLIFEIELLAIQ